MDTWVSAVLHGNFETSTGWQKFHATDCEKISYKNKFSDMKTLVSAVLHGNFEISID